jgi:putative transposase
LLVLSKAKSAIQVARTFQGRKKNFVGQHFWARGYYVSTVGKDEDAVREYIQKQEKVVNQADRTPDGRAVGKREKSCNIALKRIALSWQMQRLSSGYRFFRITL